MGDLFSGPKTETETDEKFDSGPSSFQLPYLTDAFDAAKGVYASKAGTPYYQGDTYAGMTAGQDAGYQATSDYAMGQGMTNAGAVSAYGSGMMQAGGTGALTNLDRMTALAGGDAAGDNMAAGARYAANPYVDGMIDSASRDVTRNLYENELPTIDRMASGSGNLNSSRTGIAAGIAERGAADRIGDISSQIRYDLYNSGLDRASADRNSAMNAYGTAAGQYGDLAGQGVAAMGQGAGMAYDALGINQAAQGAYQADQQGELDAAFQKWQGQDTRDMDMVARYNAIVGGTPWGSSGTSSGTSTSQTTGGFGTQLLGAAAGIGGAYLSGR